jgi:hypothetical protein
MSERLSLAAALKRHWKEVGDDDIGGLAAALAYQVASRAASDGPRRARPSNSANDGAGSFLTPNWMQPWVTAALLGLCKRNN